MDAEASRRATTAEPLQRIRLSTGQGAISTRFVSDVRSQMRWATVVCSPPAAPVLTTPRGSMSST